MSVSDRVDDGLVVEAKKSEADLVNRFVAMIVDSIIVTVAVGSVAQLVTPLWAPLAEYASRNGVQYSPLYLAVLVLYYGLMEGSSRQATLGKMVCGIQVARPDGAPLTFGRAFVRAFGRLLSIATGIGFIIAVLTERNRALHDFVAGTEVIASDS